MNLFFLYSFFSPFISSNIHRCLNNTFYDLKVLKKIITTETLNVDFHNKVSWRPLVEGDLKVPFSIATTQRCRRGHYSFPWIAPLYS